VIVRCEPIVLNFQLAVFTHPMLSVVTEHIVELAVPIVAILCVFGCKALKISRSYPSAQPDLNAEDRAKINRIAEMIDKMENRVTALETLLKEEQPNKAVTHEEAT
jgi:phage shock protein B